MKPTVFVGAVIIGTAALVAVPSAQAQDTCRPGYVWRWAFPGDHVCVTPETRAQAKEDNSLVGARRQPGGGAYGPHTCLQGFVWREAHPNDRVCVTPETRTQTAQDNAQAAARRMSSMPSAGSPPPAAPRPAGPPPAAPPAAPPPAVTRPPGAPPIAAATGGYKTGEWSTWGRAEGVEYRYRLGLNPQDPKYKDQVDAMLQLRNPGGQPWQGSARLLNCAGHHVSMTRLVNLRPQETQDVKFLTPNCGTIDRPAVKPDIARSVKID
jgi:hypothetical protein